MGTKPMECRKNVPDQFYRDIVELRSLMRKPVAVEFGRKQWADVLRHVMLEYGLDAVKNLIVGPLPNVIQLYGVPVRLIDKKSHYQIVVADTDYLGGWVSGSTSY